VSSTSVAVIRRGRERARTSRWRGEDDVAFITPAPDAPLLSAEFVSHCLETLAAQGYSRVITGALSPLEQAGFLAAGFDVEQTLRLLGIDLTCTLPDPPDGYPIRRVGRRRWNQVLDVDAAAFNDFWQMDALGIHDALRATPATRFRVAVTPRGRVAGYAICGRSGARGFVQRLAVHPDLQGSGTGSRLLLDGLAWMQRHGVMRSVVNTQSGNAKALALYLKTGFREEPVGLSVLSTGLP
jgi:GNAT superfamily N-acetyltransferase